MTDENEKPMKWKLFLQKALSENNGNPSAMRLDSTWTVFLFVLVMAFGFIWVVLFWKDVIIAYLAIIAGIIIGVLQLKNNQKGKEVGVNNVDQ